MLLAYPLVGQLSCPPNSQPNLGLNDDGTIKLIVKLKDQSGFLKCTGFKRISQLRRDKYLKTYAQSIFKI